MEGRNCKWMSNQACNAVLSSYSIKSYQSYQYSLRRACSLSEPHTCHVTQVPRNDRSPGPFRFWNSDSNYGSNHACHIPNTQLSLKLNFVLLNLSWHRLWHYYWSDTWHVAGLQHNLLEWYVIHDCYWSDTCRRHWSDKPATSRSTIHVPTTTNMFGQWNTK